MVTRVSVYNKEVLKLPICAPKGAAMLTYSLFAKKEHKNGWLVAYVSGAFSHAWGPYLRRHRYKQMVSGLMVVFPELSHIDF